MVCACCSNRTFLDGEDLTTISNRAMVAVVNDGDKLTGEVCFGKVEIRVTLTYDNARELVKNLTSRFNITL